MRSALDCSRSLSGSCDCDRGFHSASDVRGHFSRRAFPCLRRSILDNMMWILIWRSVPRSRAKSRARPPGETLQFVRRLFANFPLAGLAAVLLNQAEESFHIRVSEKDMHGRAITRRALESHQRTPGPAHQRRPGCFTIKLKQLVRCAYDLHELLDIHQRQRVVGMLQIRIHIVRCTAREALNVWIIHDGFVELPDRDRQSTKEPSHCRSRHSVRARWWESACSPHR